MLRPAAVAGMACALIAPATAQDWDCTKADDLPQQGMNWCAMRDYEAADRALNEAWPKIRARMKEVDSWQEDRLKGAEAALLKSQRAWIDYRDGQCEVEGFYARGGTLEPLIVSGCLARMTRKRTEELLLLMEEN
ncbi:lysozyme inhibitor LprI family protein [Oricola cellulosilytica]|uniref:DUF1311 domain-containing protein n=1 Tax=Oricola cellulosilytica TaxID=1429082 RepID=A0A4R0PEJ3_9HYPH|nr:lysozyme inhibitor LprI family protein [Oricola cellulosilytica]TCD14969.1 DUF1311 domain-containing protein [Oricola cellulosilytica]